MVIRYLEQAFGVASSHPDFRFRGFLFSALILISSGFGFFSFYNAVIDFYPPMLIADLIGFFSCFIGGYYLLVKKQPKVAAAILQLIVTLITFLFILVDGNEEFALAFAFFTPVMGIFLLGYKFGSILSVINFAGIFYFCFTQMGTWQPAPFLSINLIHFSFVYTILLIVSFYYDSSRRKAYQMLAEANVKLQELATTDALTALRNRRYIDDVLLNATSDHYMAMIDVDDFKQVNDQFGHDKGDKILVKLARVLVSSVGAKDIVGRWGGEEFVVIFAEPSLAHVEECLKCLNQHIAATDFGIQRPVTISIGLANHNAKSHKESLRSVDQALYEAKSKGKNTYSIAC
ncbi:hypothetical protein MACH16_01440 [Marinomonas pontica]|uniref:diguanylate cyclase n=1 Tax=Marinomonas pontica TaxID=264739 RepID=A0ABM8FAM6_9GAMM|nr:hypothetical protein MACH16_01440 [Marinomonas pontica]